MTTSNNQKKRVQYPLDVANEWPTVEQVRDYDTPVQEGPKKIRYGADGYKDKAAAALRKQADIAYREAQKHIERMNMFRAMADMHERQAGELIGVCGDLCKTADELVPQPNSDRM